MQSASYLPLISLTPPPPPTAQVLQSLKLDSRIHGDPRCMQEPSSVISDAGLSALCTLLSKGRLPLLEVLSIRNTKITAAVGLTAAQTRAETLAALLLAPCGRRSLLAAPLVLL